MGSKKRPFYRIVAADSRYQRDGRFLETLGYYNPMTTPFTLNVDKEKVLAWLNKGAILSDTTKGLLRREGIVQEYNESKKAEKTLEAEDIPATEELKDAEE